MRIHHTHLPLVGTDEPGITKEGKRDNPSAKTTVDAPDSVKLSNLSKALAGPGETRIEELRLAVEAGSYEVSAEELSGRIVNHHLKP